MAEYVYGYSKDNILVGAAAIFVGTTKNTIVDPPTGLATAGTNKGLRDAFDADATWRGVGYTTGGVEVTYTPDFGEVEVDQLLDAAVMFKQRMTVTVGTTLAQASLDNLTFAWGQDDDTIETDIPGKRTLTIESGELGDRPLERSLGFVGQAPADAAGRVYYLKRCLNVESSAHSLSRADATAIPVSLRCLPDDDGEYGTITDYLTTP